MDGWRNQSAASSSREACFSRGLPVLASPGLARSGASCYSSKVQSWTTCYPQRTKDFLQGSAVNKAYLWYLPRWPFSTCFTPSPRRSLCLPFSCFHLSLSPSHTGYVCDLFCRWFIAFPIAADCSGGPCLYRSMSCLLCGKTAINDSTKA